jgi:hypothetical protein
MQRLNQYSNNLHLFVQKLEKQFYALSLKLL